MKKLLLFLLFALIVGTIIFFPHHSLADSQKSSQPVTIILPQGQTINHDYFAGGNTILLLGTVNGDVYTAGGNVTIKGKVNGDVMAAGGTVTIDGTVTQDVRVAGGNINIIGTIGRNLTAVGGNITISESAKVPHNLTVAGGQVDISSAIGNDLNAAAGTVTIANSIGGNTTGLVGNLVLSPTATLHGNLTYTSHNQATIESGAQIMGKTTYHQTTPTEIRSEATAKKTASGILALFTWFKIVSLVSSLIVGFLVIKFVPVVVKTAGDTLLTRTWASLGLGIVTAVVVPIVLILLLITIVGIPLAFLSLAAYVIFLYMARLIVLIIIGQKLASYLSKDAGLIVGLVLGAVIYELISLIPVLNFLQFLLTYSLGLGALVMTKKSYYSTLRNKKLI